MADDDDALPLTEVFSGEGGRSAGVPRLAADDALVGLPGLATEDARVGWAAGFDAECRDDLQGAQAAVCQPDLPKPVDPGCMDPFDDMSAARDSDAEAAWYRSGLSSGVRTASGESVSGLQETADSSWDVVPAPDSSAPRRVDRAVAAAYQSLDGAMAKQVWEDDFWGRLFSSDSHDPFKGFYGTDHKRPLQPDVPATGEEPAAVKRRQAGMASLRFFEMSVVKRPAATWRQLREDQLGEALGCWVAFISRWESGVLVRDQLCSLPSEEDRKAMVADVLGNKAPATLRKRLRSLLKYETFLTLESATFPANEFFLYKFLCVERDGGASMSSRKATFEAVIFCRFALGVEELDLTVKSRRCLGNASNGEIHPKHRASPFTVEELGVLRERLEFSADAWDRVFCGAALLCTYARARWSDLMHAEQIIYDYDTAQNLAYIECPVAYHKTMRSSVMRHDLLPMVAPGLGVSGSNWARLWKLARQELGLGDPPDWPVMPAPDKQGCPTVRPLDTEEMGRWLRCIITGSSAKLGERKLSSHSCKCTVLSYAAKRGVSVSDRQLLGYHTTAYKMALTYSRDSAAHPLMVLEKLIAEIRNGVFRPDETRSGRVLSEGQVAMGRCSEVVEVKDEEADDDLQVGVGSRRGGADEGEAENDLDVTGHVTTDSSSSDSAPEEDEGPFRRMVVSPPADHDIWRHEKSRVVHYAPAGYTKVFCCGRSIGPLHVKISCEDLRWDFSKCRICNKSVNV